MKMNQHVLFLSFVAIAFGSCFVHAADPVISMAGIQVIRKASGEGMSKLVPFNTQNAGTKLALLLEVDESTSIIKIDTESSKLDAFIDSTNQSLLNTPKGNSFGFSRDGFEPFTKVSDDGKSGMITIAGSGIPSEDASKIGAKGTVFITLGSKTEIQKSDAIELSKGQSLSVGKLKLTVKSIGKPGYGNDAQEVTFETKDKAIQSIAEVRFLDEDGNEIESRSGGSSSMGFAGNYTYGRSYRLKKKLSGKTVVEFKVWSDLQELKVPFRITAGVGG